MFQSIVMALIRQALTAAGGTMVTGGYLNNDDVTSMVGAALTLASIAWSVWDKRKTAKKIEQLPWRQ